MALTVRQFRAQFPAFREAPDATIQRCIDDAYLQIAANVWGNKREAGVRYLAASLVHDSVFGEQAKLKKGKDEGQGNVYFRTYHQMMMQVTSGFRAI